ncbi:hypothetical protein NPX13_g8043 [Xylaria arbuscula]|uniref:Uncharacterized protein n=1 Tax=Xylaria arbuscula TaxID=114810 RepID=A0A9W8TKJ5_9PEZI|nr:hypothetical protein NPX13_g8043 [Xylaria arbuscula]
MKLNEILLSALVAVSTSQAGPTPILDLSTIGSHDIELLVREGIKLARSQEVEKRASADFSLERSWDNEVLFGGEWNDTTPSGQGAAHTQLSVTCLTCYTHGTVTAKVTDKHFLDPKLRLDFSGVEAYVNLEVRASAGQTFSLNLFASDSPFGIGISGLDVGVVFFVDLVFSISEAVDLTAGFQVSVPDGAFLEADIFGGDIDDSAFDGLNSQSLPVTVISGTATFKADLRLRVQAGAEASLDIFGIGAGAVVGIYANIIEFVAVIEKTPTCDLETEIWWDLNVGAYAHLDVVVDSTTLGPVPTVSTTLLTADTITSCWSEAPMTPALPATTSSIETSPSQIVTSTVPVETFNTKVTSTSEVTSIPATDSSTLIWSPSMVLTITASEVSFTMPGSSLPTNSSSSVLPTSTFASSLITSVSVSPSSFSPATNKPSSLIPSVSHSPSTASFSYAYTASTYPAPISIPSAYSSSSALATGPTYTSTYTHTMTICGAPGVMNCPATYQSEVIVTRTTTICPATTTPPAIVSGTTSTTVVAGGTSVISSSSSSSSKPTPSAGDQPITIIILTPLPTPVVATFTTPEITMTTPEHVKAYTEIAMGPDTTTATRTGTVTVTSFSTITAIASHSSSSISTSYAATPHITPGTTNPSLSTSVSAIPNENVPGNATFASTGSNTPEVTPSDIIPSPSGSQIPVTAGTTRLAGPDMVVYVGAVVIVMVALLVGFV